MSLSVITGPTGSGKTDIALQMAEKTGLPLYNADPFQFYREIPILGNQPPQKDFHLMGFRSLKEQLNAGEFGRMTAELVKMPGIWVGTGLYLGAALYGLHEDRRKGTPFQSSPARVDFRMIVLDPPRAELYDRINKRVEEMLKRGAEEEAALVFADIQAENISSTNPILKAIGLHHLLMVLAGKWTRARAIELWKRDTRRLAKRQWTWLRKFCPPSENIRWLDPANWSETDVAWLKALPAHSSID